MIEDKNDKAVSSTGSAAPSVRRQSAAAALPNKQTTASDSVRSKAASTQSAGRTGQTSHSSAGNHAAALPHTAAPELSVQRTPIQHKSPASQTSASRSVISRTNSPQSAVLYTQSAGTHGGTSSASTRQNGTSTGSTRQGAASTAGTHQNGTATGSTRQGAASTAGTRQNGTANGSTRQGAASTAGTRQNGTSTGSTHQNGISTSGTHYNSVQQTGNVHGAVTNYRQSVNHTSAGQSMRYTNSSNGRQTYQSNAYTNSAAQKTGYSAAVNNSGNKYHTQSQTRHGDYEIDSSATWERPSGKKSVRKEDSYLRDSASSAIMSAVKAVIYIIFIIGVSIPLSIFVIRTANDIFAFQKEEKIISVTIPEYATIEDVGDLLGEAGVIEYPWAFKLWSNLKEKSSIEKGYYPEFIAGNYEISTTLNYDYLRAAFKKKTARSTTKITIPEGYTVDEIIDLFVDAGISSREEFVDAVNHYDFDFRFVKELTANGWSSERFYRLEGYLFPDTYEFYTDSTAAQCIYKLLDNFNNKFIDEYYDRCADLGMTVDQAITLASMVEKEARYADELGNVSSVFHNRLNYAYQFPYLNSDATIMYAIQNDTGTRQETLTGSDTEYDSAYNTYTHRGLPPGAIANPGLNAIKYALYPNDTKYYYFVSNSYGRMLFAETEAEHLQNIIKARES